MCSKRVKKRCRDAEPQQVWEGKENEMELDACVYSDEARAASPCRLIAILEYGAFVIYTLLNREEGQTHEEAKVHDLGA